MAPTVYFEVCRFIWVFVMFAEGDVDPVDRRRPRRPARRRWRYKGRGPPKDDSQVGITQ